MNHDELGERIQRLQRSLHDGDDLARAIGLIGDALERRLNGIREEIAALDDHESEVTDNERLTMVVEQVTATLDRYGDRIEERRSRLEELVDEFQASLGSRADELDELHDRLSPSGEA